MGVGGIRIGTVASSASRRCLAPVIIPALLIANRIKISPLQEPGVFKFGKGSFRVKSITQFLNHPTPIFMKFYTVVSCRQEKNWA